MFDYCGERQIVKYYNSEMVVYTKTSDITFRKENKTRVSNKLTRFKYLTVLNKIDTRQRYYMTTDDYFNYLIDKLGFEEA